MATATGYLPPLNSREEFVDHLEGYTEPTVEELEDGKLNRKLLKTYMLETARHSSATPGMDSLFPKHVHLRRLDDPESASDDSARGLVERRRSRVTLTERLGELQDKLPDFLELYDPMHSMVQLQIPSGSRGGHLLYNDGHVTNRSDSFVEHRQEIAKVLKLYRNVTEHSEDQLWLETTEVGDDSYRLKGAPVTIRFSRPLSEETFARFVDVGLKRRTSRLRIGGYITWRGPTKVHVAAIDRHLWQPLLLEATSQQLTAVLPRGTCGNTIHRLVTNVQRWLDPNVEVWLGSESYETAVVNLMQDPV